MRVIDGGICAGARRIGCGSHARESAHAVVGIDRARTVVDVYGSEKIAVSSVVEILDSAVYVVVFLKECSEDAGACRDLVFVIVDDVVKLFGLQKQITILHSSFL